MGFLQQVCADYLFPQCLWFLHSLCATVVLIFMLPLSSGSSAVTSVLTRFWCVCSKTGSDIETAGAKAGCIQEEHSHRERSLARQRKVGRDVRVEVPRLVQKNHKKFWFFDMLTKGSKFEDSHWQSTV